MNVHENPWNVNFGLISETYNLIHFKSISLLTDNILKQNPDSVGNQNQMPDDFT